jgi:hypothetical protein
MVKVVCQSAVMAGKQNGCIARFSHSQQKVDEAVAVLAVQSGCGLVRKNYLRGSDQRPCGGNALLLANAELCNLSPPVALRNG